MPILLTQLVPLCSMNATRQELVPPMETTQEATPAIAAHSFYISSPYLGLQKEREQAKQPFVPAVSSPQDPFLVLEPSGCLVLPWLLVVPPQGLPNNIIHPSLGRVFVSGGRCFRRVMMSVGMITKMVAPIHL
jgi:hypothetical protein